MNTKHDDNWKSLGTLTVKQLTTELSKHPEFDDLPVGLFKVDSRGDSLVMEIKNPNSKQLVVDAATDQAYSSAAKQLMLLTKQAIEKVTGMSYEGLCFC